MDRPETSLPAADQNRHANAIRRLGPGDLGAFRALRFEAISTHPQEFRYSPADEREVSVQAWATRLAEDFVVGVFNDEQLIGLGGLTRMTGEKLRHKGLIWGMYVKPESRGTGAADEIISALIGHGRQCLEMLILTVVQQNGRALRFYERWGFRTFGIEPASIKLAEGSYLDEALMVLMIDMGTSP